MNPTTVIHHSADYDGIFCREIARKFLPDAKLIGWDFADAPLEIPDTAIYILDLPVDRVFGFDYAKLGNERGPQHPKGLVWIDHHKSSIDSHPKDIPGYRIDGVAACRLAWQWFFAGAHLRDDDQRQQPTATKQDFIDRIVSEPFAVRLAGEYDIWDKRDPRAEIFQFGLRSINLEGRWNELLTPNRKPTIAELEALIDVGHVKDLLEPDGTSAPALVHGLLANGKIIQDYQQHVDKGLMRSRGFDLTWEGLRFLCVNTGRFNSLTFASAVDPSKHDALLGFAWNGKIWTVSLYHAEHNKGIDLSAIAVKYGGGGHRGACGFTCDKLPFLSL